MIKEQALLESRALRENTRGHTEVLDKVKALALLPDGLHVTTEIVAEYFVVHRSTIRTLVARHREELNESGLTVVEGSDLQEFESYMMQLSNESYPQAMRRRLTLYTRRTVLNIAMLLRDSAVAWEVRAYLLDAVEGNTAAGAVLNSGSLRSKESWPVSARRCGMSRWWSTGWTTGCAGSRPGSRTSRPGWTTWGPGWRAPSTSSPG
ncbi:hypothetical protein ACGFX7_14350 [Streptomyces harbinensis]|uniref:hypothetical protein n=1 Tax=Streptomyces harbinensis TaxID=1176198 RepID=UPI0037108C9E